MKLISIHLPKTAGSTFLSTLKPYFKDKFFHFIKKGDNERIIGQLTDGCCVHGHFKPAVYKDVPDAVFITWMRHPVTRALSHYYFWKSFRFRWKFWKKRDAIQRKMIREKWSFERFALGSELRNHYTLYLKDFPMDRFSFIGITEYFEEDYRFFCEKYLGGYIPFKSENINKRAKYNISDELRKKIEEHHSLDMELYRQALAKREKRIGHNLIKNNNAPVV